MYKKHLFSYLLLFFAIPVGLVAGRRPSNYKKLTAIIFQRTPTQTIVYQFVYLHEGQKKIKNQDGTWIRLDDGTWLHLKSNGIYSKPIQNWQNCIFTKKVYSTSHICRLVAEIMEQGPNLDTEQEPNPEPEEPNRPQYHPLFRADLPIDSRHIPPKLRGRLLNFNG
jgi:hypothetical protein